VRSRPLACLFALALAACAKSPVEVHPALWQVDGPGGERAWLFGTIHTSDRPVDWHEGAVAKAFDGADEVMVEVANLADESEVAATFTRLSRTPGLPPLTSRVPASQRGALVALMRKNDLTEADFADVETWAAALTLARVGTTAQDSRNGVDRAVIAAVGKRPVVELEGASEQLGLFDALPEHDQRDLLVAVVREAGEKDADLTQSWRSGDMATIEKETRTGLLADPDLRAVLFTGRNHAWMLRIAEAMRQGHHPFVAVGAAHMAGPQGLPAMLSQQGFTVTRVQ